MLATRLKASQTSDTGPILYVGGYTQGFSGTTSDVTITFGGSLTGGLASSASKGDLVLVYFGTGSTADRNLVVAGYTEVVELYQADTFSTNLVVAYKFMGATPDSTFVLTGGTLNAADAGAVTVQVWRNVSTSSPFDVTYQSATAPNSVLCNPPAITPTTEGSVIVAGGAGAHNDGSRNYSSSDLSSFIRTSGVDTNDVSIGAGYKQWYSGSFNPAAFTFSGTNSTSFSWAAVTLALRPNYRGSTPTFLASATGASNAAFNALLTINKPAGTAEGDLMVAMMSSTGTKTWTGDTGWTEVADQGAIPSLRVAYKIAGASEPANYTFTMSSNGNDRSGAILTYRNAAYDVVGAFASGTDPLVIPSVTASKIFSRLLAIGTRAAGGITLGTPTDMTAVLTNAGTSISYIVCDQLVQDGATGTRSMSTGSATGVSGILLVLKTP
jgi:hypothetical protein